MSDKDLNLIHINFKHNKIDFNDKKAVGNALNENMYDIIFWDINVVKFVKPCSSIVDWYMPHLTDGGVMYVEYLQHDVFGKEDYAKGFIYCNGMFPIKRPPIHSEHAYTVDKLEKTYNVQLDVLPPFGLDKINKVWGNIESRYLMLTKKVP